MGPENAVEQGLKEMREREVTGGCYGQQAPQEVRRHGSGPLEMAHGPTMAGPSALEYLQRMVHELRAQAHEKAKRASQLQALIDVLPRVLPADAEEALWHLLRGL